MSRTIRHVAAVAAVLAALAASWSFGLTDLRAGETRAGGSAERVLQAAGVHGGLIVHVGCGEGRLEALLASRPGCLVHGLDRDPDAVARAREFLTTRGCYGPVAVDRFDGQRLPYVDGLVNLLIVEADSELPRTEMMRVLCPGGVARVREAGQWRTTVKPRTAEIDEWSHYLHDASNNAVAHDTQVGPPRGLRWVGSPRYARHHDRMSSVSALVSSGGRLFYIFDEAPRASILVPSRWSLIARDAFNGTVLWKRRIPHWFSQLWPLKSGPAQLPRRLVASGERVYVTLGLDAPLTALDAATGKTLMTYDATRAAEEVILSDGVLFVLVNDAEQKQDYDGRQRFARGYGAKFWDEKQRLVAAVRAESGEVLWQKRSRVLPGTLAADAKRVAFHDGESIVCLDRKTGQKQWRSEPVARSPEIRGFYLPILVLYEDVVLFSGGETAGGQTGSWYTSGEDTLTALSAETGKVLWTAYHPPSGYRSPEDLLVVDGLVWTGETTSGRVAGLFSGRDPQTGKVVREFTPDVDTYWFHHRCYRSKATHKYLLTSRAGIEFVDVRRQHWMPHHWVRGACLYGVMPANGLIYAPQHPCACYLEAKLSGFNALSAQPALPETTGGSAGALQRLEKGAAFASAAGEGQPPGGAGAEDWPTWRHDAARSGRTTSSVPAQLSACWQAPLGSRLSPPVVAGGRVFVADIDAHAVGALDAASGEQLWRFTAGGRVDSPPTIDGRRVLFGSADGWVYCLRVADGELVWRFRAAPMDRRLVAFEQVESVWPLHGSVLVHDGVVWCVAGRSMFLDGGLRLLRLDAETGQKLSETVLDQRDPQTGKTLEDYINWLNMPVALPDVLSTDGRLVYMRSQAFDLEGRRLPLEEIPAGQNADAGAVPPVQHPERAHLFSPTGLLDDSYWHRTYWLYGSTFVSGWCGYFLAGRTTPAGKILVFDDETVYGFGRLPKYYRWTTPIEHQLFAADKAASLAAASEPIDRRGEGDKRPSVVHRWTQQVPMIVRAMVLADDKLVVAGPPDLVDEEQALRSIHAPETRQRLAEQTAALLGKKGARLWVVSAADGSKLAEAALDAPPVFDGLIAAGGRLYVSLADGTLLCLGAPQ